MKKYYSVFLINLIGVSVFCQNWDLINPEAEYHYSINDLGIPEYSIRIDSVTVLNGDTTYHFNRIISECDTCSHSGDIFANVPNLFDYSCVKKGASYAFKPFKNFIIYKDAPIDSVWDFNSEVNITASITEVKEMLLFGFSDSVKTILLSNGDSILISKSFGIVKFPDSNLDVYYNLSGIKLNGGKFGKIPLDFYSIYNFEIGDLFCYSTLSSCYCEIVPTSNLSKYRIEILGKEIKGDTFIYRQKETGLFWSRNFNEPWGDTTYYSVQYDEKYVFDKNEASNYLKYQIYEYGGIALFSYADYYIDEDDGRLIKSFNKNYSYSPEVDIFKTDTPFFVHYEDYTNFYDAWKEGVGMIKKIISIGEVEEYFDLVGYVKDNVSYGTIYTDEELSSANDLYYSKKAFSVYPVVFQSFLNIESSEINKFKIEIFDISGKLLHQQEIQNSGVSTINLEELNKGVYLVNIISKEGRFSEKVFKR